MTVDILYNDYSSFNAVMARAEQNFPIVHHASSTRHVPPASGFIVLGESGETGYDMPEEEKRRAESEARRSFLSGLHRR